MYVGSMMFGWMITKVFKARLVVEFEVLLFVENCQEISTRDTANKRSLELCVSIAHVFLDGCSEWYFSVVFLTGQVLGKWYL